MDWNLEGIDLEERRFGKADALAIVDMPTKTYQNWTERDLAPGPRQSPGKAGRRRFSGFEVVALGIMWQLTQLTRIPPADALEIARQAVSKWQLRHSEGEEERKGSNRLLVFFHDGKLKVIDDWVLTQELFETTQDSDIHISIPVDHVVATLFIEICKRVKGTDWQADQIKALDDETLRYFPAGMLRELGIDLPKDKPSRRRAKGSKSSKT